MIGTFVAQAEFGIIERWALLFGELSFGELGLLQKQVRGCKGEKSLLLENRLSQAGWGIARFGVTKGADGFCMRLWISCSQARTTTSFV